MQDVIFPRYFLARFFPLEISLQDIFCWNHPSPPQKSNGRPLIYQTFSQLTDSDLSIIYKAFWENRGQNSLLERGEMCFYLPLPGESVRTYSDVITNFFRMYSLPNFLSYEATLARAPLQILHNIASYWNIKTDLELLKVFKLYKL